MALSRRLQWPAVFLAIASVLLLPPPGRAQNEFLFEGAAVDWGLNGVAAVADLDLDGRPDLVVDSLSFADGAIEFGPEIRLARPDGTYAAPVFYPDAPWFIRIAEVTSDTWPDLLAL